MDEMETELAQFIKDLKSQVFSHRKDIHTMAKKLGDARDASAWLKWSGEDLLSANERMLAKEWLIEGLELIQRGQFTIAGAEKELNHRVMHACRIREHTHMDSLIGNAKRDALIRLQQEFKERL